MGSGRLSDKRALAGCLLLGLLVALSLTRGAAWASPPQQDPSPTPPADALVMVERAIVFAAPERSAATLTHLFQRERVPVLGQSPDGRFVQVLVDGTVEGWLLRAQVELEGDVDAIPVIEGLAAEPRPTIPAQPPSATPTARATRTPQPARTPTAAPLPAPAGSASATPPDDDLPPVLPGAPPPLTIALPDGWQALDLIVPLRTFDGAIHNVPLTIYVGPLAGDATGFIYLYWGFPYTVEMTGAFNLWADGVQILRGSLVGDDCNLGLYDQQAFSVGGEQGVGAYYQASECGGEADTAGWFATLRVGEGTYAFYTAVEPWSRLADHQAALQSILDSVEFGPAEE